MWQRRWTALFAIAMAFVSAGGLGAGIVALKPVMERVLGEEETGLRDLVSEWNDAAHASVGFSLPASWIEQLPDTPWAAIIGVLVLVACLTVIGAAANFLHAYLAMTVAVNTTADLRREGFHRILYFPLGSVISRGSTDLISRVVNDTNILSRGFQALTSKAVAELTRGAAALIAAFVLDWRLTLITLTAVPILMLVIRKIGKRIRRASRGAMRGQAELLGVATEAMQGLRIVKVYNGERCELGRFTKVNQEIVRHHLRARLARAASGPITETITIIALGVLVVIAVKAIMDGKLELSAFMLTLGALGMAGSSIKPLSGVVQDINTAEAAAQRLDNIFHVPLEDAEERETRKPALLRHHASIRFEGVSFAYPGSPRLALDDITLDIEQGQTVAFVGPNGSGKTTLLTLVPRLITPDAGRVLIDGQDIEAVSLRSLRKQISVVTQEVVLFRSSIADNIAYANPDATREQIIDAAKRAHAHEFIQRLPDGYDTMMADQGLGLSGGQRQRLSIARAILRDPAILILDEATSMIDAESESAIAQALADFARGRTVLVVAHRMATIRAADRVVVMDEGRVIDQGSHAALLERSAIYRSLAGVAEESAHQPRQPAGSPPG